ncbi:GNAT family N-acetyltransferase [Lutibacter sp.]|uniref:GNAT family N-acetyltransferase n=1 Tax=Lutibacter sp. TaxID=1925666 RepID=UPI001A31E0C1|nr:GNAT family N-acetyltransferase [Lutibacter sp.]MBI9041120.1 GNAT family N-acetyltransferase [Lutibacter sp.]
MIEVKKITTVETYPIRLEVLRKNIPLPYKFGGDLNDDTFHLGAFKDKKLIAVSSYVKAENPDLKGSQFQLRGMATLTEYQGIGAGKLMMDKAFEILQEMKINCLWCNARVIAVPFYEKQGLKTFGSKFNIEYVGEHYVMFKNL